MRHFFLILLTVSLSTVGKAQLKLGSLLKNKNTVYNFTPGEDLKKNIAADELVAISGRPVLSIGTQLYVTPDECLCQRRSSGDKDDRDGAGDKDGRDGAGDKEDRDSAGDKDGRDGAGDKDGRNAAGDKDGRDGAGDKDGRNAAGDDDTRSFGGDAEGRSTSGDTDGRNGAGDRDDRSAAGDKDGRNANGDKDGRNNGGDRQIIQCRLNKKTCTMELINVREGLQITFVDDFGERVIIGKSIDLR